MTKWEEIADEWLNRGNHCEYLGEGRYRMWYDGVIRHLEVGDTIEFPENYYVVQVYDPDAITIKPVK